MSERETDAWFTGTDDPMARLEDEQRRLAELGRVWQEEKTTVRAKDNAFSMSFDGRGDLVDITFHGTKYRNLAPAELAHLLVETQRRGRLESIEKMAATMNSDALPGVDLVGLATGKVDPTAVVDSIMGPLLQGLDVPARPSSPSSSTSREDRRG